MIRLAVLDDDRTFLSEVRRRLDAVAVGLPHPFAAELFGSPFDLLEYIEKNGGFDIYLLDIIMPHMSGIQVAEEIQLRKEPSEIIFLTTSREYGVEAFGVEAAGYLVKPVSEQALSATLERAFRRLPEHRRPPLPVRTAGGLRRIAPEMIVLIESFNHDREITLSDGTRVKTPATLSALSESLRPYGEFYAPHRAYIVNLDYVSGIRGSELLLPGRVVPIARKNVKAFKEYYLKYSFGQ